MREMKAEGGWAVVCVEVCAIHPSSDFLPPQNPDLPFRQEEAVLDRAT